MRSTRLGADIRFASDCDDSQEFAPFVLDGHRLYYLNALETAVSAMEISAIAGKNVAMLLGHSYGVCKRPSSYSSAKEEL
jgi:hypothetical protein